MRFQVKGLDAHAAVVQCDIEAASAADARRQAEQQGLRVLALRGARAWTLHGLQRRERFPLVLFSQELTTLLDAGLALIDALESLAEKEAANLTRKTLQELVQLLYEGKSLSQSLARFPDVFPPLYVALVQSSEKTGAVSTALRRYVAYRQRIDEVRQKVAAASVYPVLLLVVGGGVLLFLMGYVVPRFSLVFEGLGTELPWLSRVLMNSGMLLHTHYQALLVGAVAGIATLTLLLRRPGFRALLARNVERVPAVHRRLVMYELARFYRSLGILLQGGIPLLTAMEMARNLLGAVSRPRLDQACRLIREGRALSDALEGNQLSTPVSLRLLRTGEQSGNLGEMMERTADFYDEELGRWVDWFMRLFEPLLMTGIGILIGVIVILMYIPIFELASSIH
ncbi:type II secretion system F family protein [Pseudomonas citronellolis]|uniref:type II secretion system F family protein n=1 Tax=Pseudomonas citronellolis TaxID=53408 RepID=UPI0023E3ECD7|nr:type II secretion system F family protein [Pseudomonas citronellolis]MDF3935206.1 type II secretion system F family protein [Pseudomonas citronellolis]